MQDTIEVSFAPSNVIACAIGHVGIDGLVVGHARADGVGERDVAGALIVFEALIDDDRRENAFGLLMSLNMLIETPGGFDYTGADCSQWMREAGFSRTRVEPLVGPDSMVVGIK
jgi:hypothetical protein